MTNKTLERIAVTTPYYMDQLEWKFYESMEANGAVHHSVKLEMLKLTDEKYPTIVVTIDVQDQPELVLRFAAYDFAEMNNLFKRASFRLEK
jgi:hypothetical protein